jgi:hypothetical protein
MDECKHESVFRLGGKTADRCSWTFPDGTRGDGYVPSVGGLGGGDYLSIKICMTCHRVVGFNPEDVLELQLGETRIEEDE